MKYPPDPRYSYDRNIPGFDGFDTKCTPEQPNVNARLHLGVKLDDPGDRCYHCGWTVQLDVQHA